jgi:hypothetical protein
VLNENTSQSDSGISSGSPTILSQLTSRGVRRGDKISCFYVEDGFQGRIGGKAATLLNLPAVFLGAVLEGVAGLLHVPTGELTLLAFSAVFVPVIWFRLGKWVDVQTGKSFCTQSELCEDNHGTSPRDSLDGCISVRRAVGRPATIIATTRNCCMTAKKEIAPKLGHFRIGHNPTGTRSSGSPRFRCVLY